MTTDHDCFIAAGAGGLIDPTWCIDHYAPMLAHLPADITEPEITCEALRIYTDDQIEVFYTPFDYVNPAAQVVLVGITPGRQQLHQAVIAAGAVLRGGGPVTEALQAADRSGSFAGTMRTNLVAMAEGIGLAGALGISTCDALFGDRADLASTTSVICHAVMTNGENYTGSRPAIDRHPLLDAFARQVLAANLAVIPDALVIPLGVAASRAVRELSGVDPARVLTGFPHPSGGNGWRRRHFEQAREAMTHTVAAWAG